MLRAVLDTNVIVSGVISKKGAPFLVLQAWYETRFVVIISKRIIREVQRVLSEPRLKNAFHIADERIARLGRTLRQDAILVPGTADVHGAIPEDSSDEMFLAAALDGRADFIISGDTHLLSLRKFEDIAIFTPRQFLDRLEREMPV